MKETGLYCVRCGLRYYQARCVHTGTDEYLDHDEAERIRARYQLGKQFNPDHDETSYRDGN